MFDQSKFLVSSVVLLTKYMPYHYEQGLGSVLKGFLQRMALQSRYGNKKPFWHPRTDRFFKLLVASQVIQMLELLS